MCTVHTGAITGLNKHSLVAKKTITLGCCNPLFLFSAKLLGHQDGERIQVGSQQAVGRAPTGHRRSPQPGLLSPNRFSYLHIPLNGLFIE